MTMTVGWLQTPHLICRLISLKLKIEAVNSIVNFVVISQCFFDFTHTIKIIRTDVLSRVFAGLNKYTYEWVFHPVMHF